MSIPSRLARLDFLHDGHGPSAADAEPDDALHCRFCDRLIEWFPAVDGRGLGLFETMSEDCPEVCNVSKAGVHRP